MSVIRVLLADDHALVLAGIRALVEELGDTQRALTLMREQQPDLVILDVNMPRMSGFEVLERMRKAGITTTTILLTARHSREDTVTGFRLGATLEGFGLPRVPIGNFSSNAVICIFKPSSSEASAVMQTRKSVAR